MISLVIYNLLRGDVLVVSSPIETRAEPLGIKIPKCFQNNSSVIRLQLEAVVGRPSFACTSQPWRSLNHYLVGKSHLQSFSALRLSLKIRPEKVIAEE